MKIDIPNKRITIRQSWIDTFGRCPEQARASITNPEDDHEGDSAMSGTAAHAAIEQFLLGNIGWGDMVGHAAQVATDAAMHGVVQKDGTAKPISYLSFEDAKEMIHWAQHCVVSWQKILYPHLERNDWLTGDAELRFEYDAFQHNDWTVAMQGTVDWVPASGNVLIDWKTSKGKYRQKDKQKWAVQPSAYAMAAMSHQFGREFELPLKFQYGVMHRLQTKHSAEIVEVERHQGHIDWFVQRCRAAVDMYDGFGLDRPWPKIDSSNFLCSAKWCPNYSKCRGAYVTGDMDLYGYTPK